MLELGAGCDEALYLARPPLSDAPPVRHVQRLRQVQRQRRRLAAAGQLAVDPRAQRERPQLGAAREGVPRSPDRSRTGKLEVVPYVMVRILGPVTILGLADRSDP